MDYKTFADYIHSTLDLELGCHPELLPPVRVPSKMTIIIHWQCDTPTSPLRWVSSTVPHQLQFGVDLQF